MTSTFIHCEPFIKANFSCAPFHLASMFAGMIVCVGRRKTVAQIFPVAFTARPV